MVAISDAPATRSSALTLGAIPSANPRTAAIPVLLPARKMRHVPQSEVEYFIGNKMMGYHI